MRTDLTSNFLIEKDKINRKPIQLLHFHFDNTIYVSDRNITINGKEYLNLVENWGTLETIGEVQNYDISETLQLTITLWNGGNNPFSNYFIGQDTIDIKVDLYQTFEGLEETDQSLISSFVIQEPIEIVESSKLLTLDLVSINLLYTGQVGNVLTKANYPKAYEPDINKGINLIVGQPDLVECLFSNSPLLATMSGSILKLPTIVNVFENLDELGFPEAGHIVIDQEIMYYDFRDEDTFNVTKRGQLGTLVSEHSDGAEVLEYITDYEWIIGEGPLTAVDEVRAGGQIVNPSEYTLDLTSNPATITFSEQPTFITYSRGARTTIVDFDSVAGNNNAFQAHYSFDLDFRTSGALISRDFTPLSILQIDAAIDDGEVVRAFLSVEHWATELYANDQVQVWVDGLGTIGTLSKPNPADITDFQADVDIDHAHNHIVGGTHEHNFDNPNIATNNPSHNHPPAGFSIITIHASGLPTSFSIPEGITTYKYFNFTGSEYAESNTIVYTINWLSGIDENITIRQFGFRRNGNYYYYDISPNTIGLSISVGAGEIDSPRFRIRYIGAGSSVNIFDVTCRLESRIENTIDYRQTTVQSNLTTIGDVNLQNVDTGNIPIKDKDDVEDLATANRQLENIVSQSSSRSVTERFDLTQYLETISWDFFQNRQVELRYIGSANTAQIIVTYISLEVEYRQRTITNTRDITCKPVGSIGNRPDEVIQYLLTDRAGLPSNLLGSIFTNPALWDDTLIWDDTDIWMDGGEKLDAPEGALFEDAAARFEFLGYTIDGVIDATNKVKDAIAKIAFQSRSRLIWSAGQAKLFVLEKLDNWIAVKQIGKAQTQLRSLTISKGESEQIINSIDLFYKVNRISDAQGTGIYDATTSLIDNDSINKHGLRTDNEKFSFDLVRNENMASDLVDYYLFRYSEPPTYYEFKAYLQQYELEKGDIIRFTSDFFNIQNKPMRILNNTRTFGSGKNKSINLITLFCETIKQRELFIQLFDVVNIQDETLIGVPREQDNNDVAFFIEEILYFDVSSYIDGLNLSDEIVIIMAYGPKISDTLTITEELSFDLELKLSDLIRPFDDINLLDDSCFGACPFGGGDGPDCVLPFGSKGFISDNYIDESTILDEIELTVVFSLEFEDSITVSDSLFSSESFSDSITFEEELIFNSCFGCPVDGATGFGLNNFGR